MARRDPEFQFRTYPVLSDGEIELSVERKHDGRPPAGWAPAYDFRITLSGHSERVGGISLRIGDTPFLRLYGGHIGYGIVPAHRGHRYAAKACRLVRSVALDHGMGEIWITCNPENIASRRTCEIVGAQFVEIVDVPPDTDLYQRGERRKCRYRWQLAPADDSGSRGR